MTYIIEHLFDSATLLHHTHIRARAYMHERPQEPIWAPFSPPPICEHHSPPKAPQRNSRTTYGQTKQGPRPAEAETEAQHVNQVNASPDAE